MFNLDICKKIVKTLSNCDKVSCKNLEESLKNDRFPKVLMRVEGVNNKGDSISYVKNVCEFLQSQVELCMK